MTGKSAAIAGPVTNAASAMPARSNFLMIRPPPLINCELQGSGYSPQPIESVCTSATTGCNRYSHFGPRYGSRQIPLRAPHPFRIKDTLPVVKRAVAAVKAGGLARCPHRQRRARCQLDGASRHPTVTFGAGQNEAHTIDEWINLDDRARVRVGGEIGDDGVQLRLLVRQRASRIPNVTDSRRSPFDIVAAGMISQASLRELGAKFLIGGVKRFGWEMLDQLASTPATLALNLARIGHYWFPVQAGHPRQNCRSIRTVLASIAPAQQPNSPLRLRLICSPRGRCERRDLPDAAPGALVHISDISSNLTSLASATFTP